MATPSLIQQTTYAELLERCTSSAFKDAWEEACGRGPKWRQLLLEGLSQLSPQIKDIVLKSVGE